MVGAGLLVRKAWQDHKKDNTFVLAFEAGLRLEQAGPLYSVLLGFVARRAWHRSFRTCLFYCSFIDLRFCFSCRIDRSRLLLQVHLRSLVSDL